MSREYTPLNMIDDRLHCPRCGERQTSLIDERGDVDKWSCDLCNIKFYVLGGTKLKEQDKSE